MCLGVRFLSDGAMVHAQCPSTEAKPEDMQRIMLKIAAANPDLTLLEFSKGIEKSVWWIFETMLFDIPPKTNYPRKGDKYITGNNDILIVQKADKFAVHWQNVAGFSLYEDVEGMTR